MVWWQRFSNRISAGIIIKSANHPLLPWLSDLYPGRSLTAVSNDTATTPAAYLSLAPANEDGTGLELTIAGQWNKIRQSALRVWYRERVKKLQFGLGYLREGILSFSELNRNNTANAFIGWYFSTPLIADILRIEWETYHTWYKTSQLRTRLWVSAIF